MPANYLHGVETVEITTGPRPVQVVKTSVIALVGTAPSGPINTPTLVLSEVDAAQFGAKTPGYTIPYALDGIFDHGAGTVIVVNVFDPAVHKDAQNAPDPSRVEAADIIGEVDALTEARSGLACLRDIYTLFGFTPKIIIAPGFSPAAAVAVEMVARAEQFRAIALLDAPAGITVSQAIAGRGPSGEINFNTSSGRAVLLYPGCRVYDAAAEGGVRVEGLSARAAGLMAAVDLAEGYWTSPSNHELRGILGMETPVSSGINDPQSEANLLNEKGITTLFNAYGTGIRLWGNRTAAWPTVTAPKNFLPVRRVGDVLHESVEWAMLQFLDQPVTRPLIDSICGTVEQFIRTLVMRGALVDGACRFSPAKNPETEIALGHLTFDLEYMPPTPAERITFESHINTALLKALTAQ